MVFTPGLKATANENWRDPHVPYGTDEEGRPAKIKPREGQAFWRHVLPFALAKRAENRPMVVGQLEQLLESGYPLPHLELDCYGMRTDKMKVFEWHHQTLLIPLDAFRDPSSEDEVEKALAIVTGYDQLLRDRLKELMGERRSQASRELWVSLREPFQSQILDRLGKEHDLEAMMKSWEGEVIRASLLILERFLGQAGARAQAMLAAANMRQHFHRSLAEPVVVVPGLDGPSLDLAEPTTWAASEAAQRVLPLLDILRGRGGRPFAEQLRRLAREDQGVREESVTRRMRQILECRSDQRLVSLLRQAFRLLSVRKWGLDQPQLLRDLAQWHRPDRAVQRRWAAEFFPLPTRQAGQALAETTANSIIEERDE
jgi:hypothetical protein